MSTFLQTPQGDLALVVGPMGLKNLSLITDVAAVCAQKLNNRFLLALGEWFLNVLVGVPYFQVVLVKNPDLLAIRSLFSSIILSTPPIVSLTSLTLNYNRGPRTLSFPSFVAVTDAGQKIVAGNGAPFVVSVQP